MSRDDPLDAVYSYAERVYVRLQAVDVLNRCLENGSSEPLQKMVEGLVLAGPNSLEILREIRTELEQRQAQVKDDLHQVYSEIETSLKSCGVSLGMVSSVDILQLSPVRFLDMLRDQGIDEEEKQVTCLKILHNSRDLVHALAVNIRLMDEIAAYLEDWIGGLAYQSARKDSNPGL